MASGQRIFRDTFKVSKELVTWYPGHMKHSFTHMQAKMRRVDCVIEVHDARIPFSGRNPIFLKSLLGTKPHILVLNKVDLIDKSRVELIMSKYSNEDYSVLFTNSLNQKCKGLKQIIPFCLKLIKNSATPALEGESNYKMMVVGIPNVGKSSVINALRNQILHRGKATLVGGIAGVTRSVLNEIKVCSEPPTFLIDTPGILLPKVESPECGMKLALCSCLRDEVVGIVYIADFLLFWLNKKRNFKYVSMFDLKNPSDDVTPILIKIALMNNKTTKVKNIVNNSVEVVPDIYSAANYFVKLFRKGELGDINLDEL